MTPRQAARFIFSVVVVPILLATAFVGLPGSAPPQIKPVAITVVDPWTWTADDTLAVHKTFRDFKAATLEDKAVAAAKEAVAAIKARVDAASPANPTPTNPTPQPQPPPQPSPSWLELPVIDMNPDGTPVVGPITKTQIVDLSRFTAVEIPIGDNGNIAFYDTGFVVLRTPKTEAVEKAVRERFGVGK